MGVAEFSGEIPNTIEVTLGYLPKVRNTIRPTNRTFKNQK